MSASEGGKIKWKKILGLYAAVYFYSFVLYIVFLATGTIPFDVNGLLSTLFPIIFGKYWFFSAYIVMMLASPFVNVVIRRLEKKQYAVLCLFLIVVAALEDIVGALAAIPLSGGFNGIWFIFLYFIAGYIRKFDVTLSKREWWAYFALVIGLYAMTYFVDSNYTSLNTVLITIFIILTAKQHPIKNVNLSKVICFVSKLTFGIYLIHDSNEMRGFMYENIFHSSQLVHSDYSFLIYIGFVLATFTACAIIEYVRQLLFKLVGKSINKIRTKNCQNNNA